MSAATAADTTSPRSTALSGTSEPDDQTNRIVAALNPVRRALLASASAEAARAIAESERKADSLITEVEHECDTAVAAATQRQQRAEHARQQREAARARSEAHRHDLAQRTLRWQELTDELHTAARAMRFDPRYPRLLDHLEQMAYRQLGPDAVIDRDPDPDGGIVATAGPRQVDYRLTSLADRALHQSDDEVAAALWD